MKIKTDRLIVRDFEPADARDLYEILGDDETMQFCEPAYDFEKTVHFLNDFCIGRRGALAAQHLDSGNVIGYILFNEYEKAAYEIGWFFNRQYWRRGYAYEALKAVIRYAFSECSARKVFAETIDIQRSVPLMEKLGMRPEKIHTGGALDLQGNPVNMYEYSLTDDQWNK